MRETFNEFWEKPEQEELRYSCAKGWAEQVWNAALAVDLAVKAEQVQCEECGGDGAGGDHEDDCSKAIASAPAQPAAQDQDEVQRLREALEEIRKRSAINRAMNPNPYELTALLGDIHQIADADMQHTSEGM